MVVFPSFVRTLWYEQSKACKDRGILKDQEYGPLRYPGWRGRIFLLAVLDKSRGNENHFTLFVQSLISFPQTRLKRKNTFENKPPFPKHKLMSLFSRYLAPIERYNFVQTKAPCRMACFVF